MKLKVLKTIVNKFNKKFGIFSTKKVLNNKLLNLFGIQPLRLIIAKLFYYIRLIFFKSKIDKKNEQLIFLKKNGYLILENFLNEKDFDDLNDFFTLEMKKTQIDNYKNRFSLSMFKSGECSFKNSLYPQFFKQSFFKNIFESYFCKNIENSVSSIHMEKIVKTDKKNELKDDPQQYFHRDTFYGGLKGIYFLGDVTSNHGTLEYLPKSNKIDLKKIKLEYMNSISSNNSQNLRDGTSILLTKSYYEKSIQFLCKKNTLVIFDVSGFHRRLKAKNRYERNTIRIGFRIHPFSLII